MHRDEENKPGNKKKRMKAMLKVSWLICECFRLFSSLYCSDGVRLLSLFLCLHPFLYLLVFLSFLPLSPSLFLSFSFLGQPRSLI
jgi:hypothetical protein